MGAIYVIKFDVECQYFIKSIFLVKELLILFVLSLIFLRKKSYSFLTFILATDSITSRERTPNSLPPLIKSFCTFVILLLIQRLAIQTVGIKIIEIIPALMFMLNIK